LFPKSFEKFWTSDGRLDVVVLGPMTDTDDHDDTGIQLSANCEVIKEVADAVFAESQMVVGFDIPSTAYALRRSPRYNTLAAQTRGAISSELVRLEQSLLNRFITATQYLLQRAFQLEDLGPQHPHPGAPPDHGGRGPPHFWQALSGSHLTAPKHPPPPATPAARRLTAPCRPAAAGAKRPRRVRQGGRTRVAGKARLRRYREGASARASGESASPKGLAWRGQW
jgi:hypothetical protein